MFWNFAVVAATLLGPVFAVQVQKYLERWRDESERRKKVFKTLMATRAARLSQAHVEALNLIDLEFPAARKRFKRVRSAWRAYLTHLSEVVPGDPQLQAVFYAKRQDLFEDMLYEMALALGYDFDKTQIGKDAYSTQYQEKMEADALLIRTKLVEILTGQAAFPMAVVQFPSDPETMTAQTEYLKLMAEHLRAGKPWPINVVGSETGKVIPMRPAEEKTESDKPGSWLEPAAPRRRIRAPTGFLTFTESRTTAFATGREISHLGGSGRRLSGKITAAGSESALPVRLAEFCRLGFGELAAVLTLG